MKYWISKYPTLLHERFNTNFIIEGCRLILDNNCFEFNLSYYKQILGTAMGTKFAPAYATLVLGYLEETLFTNLSTKFSNESVHEIKTKYFRYLDDILCIWDLRRGEISILQEELGTLDNQLTFKCDQFGNQVNFLDLKLCKENNIIQTDIFYKATDSHQYLDFKSNHPRHVKANIPFNLARRICTLVSKQEWRNICLTELSSFLTTFHYHKSLIN